MKHFSDLNIDIKEAKLARNYYGSLGKFLKVTKLRKQIKHREAILKKKNIDFSRSFILKRLND